MSITQRAKDMGVEELVKENRKLKEENESIKEDLENAGNLLNVLEEENRKLKEELAHYKNTEAIQKSNNASRYNPYNHKSYVDREFNVIP